MIKMRTLRSEIVLLSLLMFAVCYSGISRAAEVPRFHQQVSLQAVDQPVPVFLESLFSQIGVPLKIEPGIPGTVNGAFNGTAKSVFEKVSQAFSVYLYYDTSVAHVYRSANMQASILPLSQAAAKRVVASAEQIGLTDARNSVSPVPGGGLMVSGGRRFLQQIESISKASTAQKKATNKQAAPPRVEFRLFRLKYAWADDVQLDVGGRTANIPGVATLLRTLVADDGSLPYAAGTTVERHSRTVPKLRGQGLQAVSNNTNEVVAQPQLTASSAGNKDFSIVAQPQLNAVAIRDTADRMPMYEQLIKSLDVEPEMVEIEATIIDINVDRQRELGVNWRADGSDVQALVGDGSAADELLQAGAQITPRAQGGALSLVLGDSTQFFARVKALEQEGAARIVSKPHVLTLSNVEAVLGATTEFFVRVGGNDEVDLFNVPVGTVLRVTPHVYGEGEQAGIKLLVNIEDGSANSGAQVDNIPVVDRSTISTQALVKEGSSLLIGGLVRESVRDSEERVPLLGNLPLLGNAFKSRRSQRTKTERLFMITPRTAKSYQRHLNLRGPVLQGDAVDLISAPDRIDLPTFDAVEKKSENSIRAINNQRQPVENAKPVLSALDPDKVMALLRIPEMTKVSASANDQQWNAWYEVGGSRPRNNSGDSITHIASVGRQNKLSFTEQYINRKAERQYREQQTGSFDAKTVEESSEVKQLAAGILEDLKQRKLTEPRGDNALEKVQRMKAIAPDHDYAINGDSYVARVYASLGNSARKRGEIDRANRYLEMAMQIDRKAKGVEALQVALR